MDESGEVWISTIFLGLDHNYNPESVFPLLFETRISGGKHDSYMDRYISWDEAVLGHKKLTRFVRMRILWEKSKLEEVKK